MKKLEDYQAVLRCPFGGIGLRLQDDRLVELDFIYESVTPSSGSSESAKNFSQQIAQYFKNPEYPFTIPLDLQGTEFQKRVWQELQRIPVGQVKTYGEIAKKLQSSPRAVGNACRRNPVPIVVPCHRVVAQNGLGGFSGKTEGQTIAVKQWLLNFEAHQ